MRGQIHNAIALNVQIKKLLFGVRHFWGWILDWPHFVSLRVWYKHVEREKK